MENRKGSIKKSSIIMFLSQYFTLLFLRREDSFHEFQIHKFYSNPRNMEIVYMSNSKTNLAKIWILFQQFNSKSKHNTGFILGCFYLMFHLGEMFSIKIAPFLTLFAMLLIFWHPNNLPNIFSSSFELEITYWEFNL